MVFPKEMAEPKNLKQTQRVLARAKDIDDARAITIRVLKGRFQGRSKDEINKHVSIFTEFWDKCNTDDERLKVAQSALDYSS